MLPSERPALARRLLEYIDTQSTAMAADLYHQPVSEYMSPAIAAREREVLFRSLPLCIGLSGMLPTVGSYFTHDHTGLPLLLTRDDDGEVHALLNVCRHRGARLIDGCGETRMLRCPYHAWAYAHDGRLAARPADEAFAGMPRTTHGLRRLAVEERDGLLWIMPRLGAPLALERHLGAVGEQIASFGLAGFHHFATRTMARRMNWKLALDTFLESYHFCVLHRNSICNTFYDNLGAFDTWGRHFRLVSPRKTLIEARDPSAPGWCLLPHVVGIYVLFPNTVLVWQLDHLELFHIYPGATPDESVTTISVYIPEPPQSESARAHWQRNFDIVVGVVEREDFPVGEGTQRGFHSGAQEHIVFGRNEPALGYFHRAVSEALTG